MEGRGCAILSAEGRAERWLGGGRDAEGCVSLPVCVFVYVWGWGGGGVACAVYGQGVALSCVVLCHIVCLHAVYCMLCCAVLYLKEPLNL